MFSSSRIRSFVTDYINAHDASLGSKINYILVPPNQPFKSHG
jgi:hypothetical protein